MKEWLIVFVFNWRKYEVVEIVNSNDTADNLAIETDVIIFN